MVNGYLPGTSFGVYHGFPPSKGGKGGCLYPRHRRANTQVRPYTANTSTIKPLNARRGTQGLKARSISVPSRQGRGSMPIPCLEG